MRKKIFFLILCLSVYLGISNAHAFDPPRDTAEGIEAYINGPQKISPQDTPAPITLNIKNNNAISTHVHITVQGIDGWRILPQEEFSKEIPAQTNISLNFTLSPPDKCYNAHYPVHARIKCSMNGKNFYLHPILIFETIGFDSPKTQNLNIPWTPQTLQTHSRIPLHEFPVFRVLIFNGDQLEACLPPGSQGMHYPTRALVELNSYAVRGQEQRAIAMHPAWFGGYNGPVLIEFPLVLPPDTPISFRFSNAIRDHDEARGEPPSDGVTFRVRITDWRDPDNTLGRIIFEKHTTTKIWEESLVNLSEYAGKTIRLQLEAHPGPANDTTCDGCFWGEPTLIIGEPNQVSKKIQKNSHFLGTIFVHNQPFRVLIEPGEKGLVDASLWFETDDHRLGFSGFSIQAVGTTIDAPTIQYQVEENFSEGVYQTRLLIKSFRGNFELVGKASILNNALQIRFDLENPPPPEPWFAPRIEKIALKSWSEAATRVYAGVGNVLVEPQNMVLHFEGHQLATSFVGLDFPSGISILQGVNVTPTFFRANTADKLFTLETSSNQTIYLIPAQNIWHAADIWRKHIDKRPPGAGTSQLAGRFVFDLWGGFYKESAELLKKAFHYGLTDSVVVWHVWQRYVYDFRLPDIYPPNPELGSLEEFLHLAQTCKEHGVLFAVHDNYIDFYPDADEFSYEKISFYENNTPQRGWFNHGRNAQAYRFRPDCIQPFVERNLALIKQNISPTAYFIDVWSSMGPHDFWSSEGKYFDQMFTRSIWGKTFDWIRNYLNGVPQISESGHDQLIGHLDGAQTNHLRWGTPDVGTHGKMVWDFPAKDGERIPWLDFAYHERFILHGAGYEQRFCSGLDPRLHGMYSDDYINVEVMTGHPGMVDKPFHQNVVRKYWLLHDLMRALAKKQIQSVAFVEDDIHRQHIQWENADVYVNRSSSDWRLDNGITLPQYGFWAKAHDEQGDVTVGIIQKDSITIEFSESPHSLFVNSRTNTVYKPQLEVKVEYLKLDKPRTIQIGLIWHVNKPLMDNYCVFVHFISPDGKIVFQNDFLPEPSTQTWQGIVKTERTIVIPETLDKNQPLELRVGLYNTNTLTRVPIDGYTDGNHGVRLAKITLTENQNSELLLEWIKIEDPLAQNLLNRKPTQNTFVNFGYVSTNGAIQLTKQDDYLLVTPLPETDEFSVTINWAQLPWQLATPTKLIALNEESQPCYTEMLTWEGDHTSFVCKPGIFRYRLE